MGPAQGSLSPHQVACGNPILEQAILDHWRLTHAIPKVLYAYALSHGSTDNIESIAGCDMAKCNH